MKTLAVVDGDLVLDASRYATVSGSQRVAQDLGIALREHFGVDRFHPNWGSLLPTYVGAAMGEGFHTQIAGEVKRVLGNYMAVQDQQVRSLAGQPEQLDSRDVVVAVSAVDVQTTGSSRFDVRITLQTLSGGSIGLSLPVGE